jgi:hypothetical protein
MNNKIDVSQMSFDELHAAHIELWDWLSKNPSGLKYEWSGWERYDDDGVINYCFACVYASRFSNDDNNNLCSFCPIKDWSCAGCEDIMSQCKRFNSLYERWDNLSTPLTEYAALAAQIRDLPWVEGEVSQ